MSIPEGEEHVLENVSGNTENVQADLHETQEEKEDTKVDSQIKEVLKQEREKNKELYDKYLRIQAEFDNFRKRMEREKCDYYKYSLERLIKDILPVLDNLDLAIRSAEKSRDFEKFSEGVKLIYKQLGDTLQKEGLTSIVCIGEKFDPCKHEAVLHLESEQHEENMIMEEHKKGYFLNERLIRPALVTVAKDPIKKKQGKD